MGEQKHPVARLRRPQLSNRRFTADLRLTKKTIMPNYTLHYFNGRGRAEICRMMFHMAGVQYMDKRYEFSDWERCRNDFPCGYLPCLQMDNGYMMPETMAICRYLAREYGFYPRSSMDMMRCDYICDCFYEIMHDYMRYYHWKNGRFRYNWMDGGMMGSGMMGSGMMGSGMMGSGMGSGMGCGDMMNCNYDNYMYWRYMNTFNRIMPFMERSLCMRNGGNMYFMGDQMTWCDMMFYCCMENMYMENQSMFSNYPRMMGLYNRMAAHPKICSYLRNRCNTCW
uniref:S-crystallin n=1 Tax=Doryteuthis pealeii TaxID=1051067 RepID=A0A8E6P5D3_DORPE|nr:S-crystallin [Doryteuthis pealeii]